MLNRRVAEASALRSFFQSQWDYIQELLDTWQESKEREEKERREVHKAVETIVDGTDTRLRSLGSYQDQLRKSTRDLLFYIDGLISAMPSPLLVDRSTLVTNPTVRRLFKSPRLVASIFDENQAVRDYFRQHAFSDDDAYAMVFAYRDEKRILGSEMQGEMIVRDVEQTQVTFSGHEVIGLHPSEEKLRSGLKRTLFENVVDHIRLETVKLRHGRSDEEQRLHALNPHMNINNPHVYMDKLQEILSVPKRLVAVKNKQLTINKMGIKISPDTESNHFSSADTLHLNEVAIGGNRARVVCLVRYPRPALT